MKNLPAKVHLHRNLSESDQTPEGHTHFQSYQEVILEKFCHLRSVNSARQCWDNTERGSSDLEMGGYRVRIEGMMIELVGRFRIISSHCGAKVHIHEK